MDRHSIASDIRASGLTARKCVLPVILVLGSLQAAIAQSTVHFMSAPGETPTSGTQMAAVPNAWPAATVSDWQGVAASEIRIIGPPSPGQLTWSPTEAAEPMPIRAERLAGLVAEVAPEPTEPIDGPTSLVPAAACPSLLSPVGALGAEPARAVTAVPVDMTSPRETMHSVPADELDLAAGLTAASVKDILAASRRFEVPVDSLQTDLFEGLTSYVLASRPPAESQPLLVSLAEGGRMTESPDLLITTPPIAAEAQDFAELLAGVLQTDRLQAIGQPTMSASSELVAVPSAPQPLAADTDIAALMRQAIAEQPPVSSQPDSVAATPVPLESRTELSLPTSTFETASAPQRSAEDSCIAAPAHLASTTYPAADNGRMIRLLPSQHSYVVGRGSESADQLVIQEAEPVRSVPDTSAAATSIALHDESLASAIGRPPVFSLAANELPAANRMDSMDVTVGSPATCPYLPCQSGAQYVCGIECGNNGAPCCQTWQDSHCIPWSLFGPGEYVGPARTEHVSTYYLRVNDIVTLTFITSRRKEAERYRIGCGDELTVVWVRDASEPEWKNDRNVRVQPDGTIALPLIGEVTVAGKTVQEATSELVKLYSKYQREPQVSVIPLVVNTATEDIIRAVTSVSGSNGQTQALRVTPEGTIQAPGIGSVFAQGLTLDELASELKARYTAAFGPGLMVSPSLTERATSYAFVGGEVRVPGRYTLEGPTTVMQAITLAGGWNNGGNLHQVVVFRRDENWCLKAIKIDVHAPLYGRDPCPANDVWLRDNDLVIVPKSPVLCATDAIELYFTRGVYAVFPISFVYDFTKGTAITPVP